MKPNKVFFALITLIIFAASGCSISSIKENNDILNGSFWKNQALQDIIPYWTQHALDHDNGAFITNLDREWNQFNGTDKFPGMISRHIFSYSVAFLLIGDEKYIEIASETVDFLLEHAWDKDYGGWFDTLNEKGNPVRLTKNYFMQTYSNTGLAMYYFVTHDPKVLQYIEKSNNIMETKRWDNKWGGYCSVLNQDLSVKSCIKSIGIQVSPVSGYLIYLYLATREGKYLEQMERIMDLILARMQDPETEWILEAFDREWNIKDDASKSRVHIGGNIEVAWMLYRLYLITGKKDYIERLESLTEKIVKWGFNKETGVWYDTLEISDPSIHKDSSVWWIQAYGNMYNLYLYRIFHDDKYIECFKKGANFWNNYFIDKEFGDTFISTYANGKMRDGTKAHSSKTSYHSMEHSLLNYLCLDLWKNKKEVELNFLITSPKKGQKLYPLPIEDKNIKLKKVIINGKTWKDFNKEEAYVNLPELQKINIKAFLSQ